MARWALSNTMTYWIEEANGNLTAFTKADLKRKIGVGLYPPLTLCARTTLKEDLSPFSTKCFRSLSSYPELYVQRAPALPVCRVLSVVTAIMCPVSLFVVGFLDKDGGDFRSFIAVVYGGAGLFFGTLASIVLWLIARDRGEQGL
jgi:hypothetical protein